MQFQSETRNAFFGFFLSLYTDYLYRSSLKKERWFPVCFPVSPCPQAIVEVATWLGNVSCVLGRPKGIGWGCPLANTWAGTQEQHKKSTKGNNGTFHWWQSTCTPNMPGQSFDHHDRKWLVCHNNQAPAKEICQQLAAENVCQNVSLLPQSFKGRAGVAWVHLESGKNSLVYCMCNQISADMKV